MRTKRTAAQWQLLNGGKPQAPQDTVKVLMEFIQEYEEAVLNAKRVANYTCRDHNLPLAYPEVEIDMHTWRHPVKSVGTA